MHRLLLSKSELVLAVSIFLMSVPSSAQLVHEFPDLIIYADPPPPNAPGSIRGNCDGAPCRPPTSTNRTPGTGASNKPRLSPDQNGKALQAPRPHGGATMESISGKEFMDFVRGSNPRGIDDPRVAGLLGSGSDFGSASSSNPVVAIQSALSGLLSRNILTPLFVTDTFISELNVYFSQKSLPPGSPSLILPPLPSSDDVTAIAKELADKAATAGKFKWQNPSAVYAQFSNIAQNHASKEVRASLERIEGALKPIYESGGSAVSRIMGGAWPEVELIANAISADVSLPSKGVRRSAKLDAAGAQRAAQVFVATSASELFKRNYNLLPSGSLLRGALEAEYPDSVILSDIREPPANGSIAGTYSRIDKFIPATHQGRLGRMIAEYLAISANREYLYGGEENRARAEIMRQTAEQVLDLVSGFVPVFGPARDVYELYSGESLITGLELTPTDRAILLVSVASLGLSKWAPRPAVAATVNGIKDFCSRLRLPWNNRLAQDGGRIADELRRFGQQWPNVVAKLRAAAAPAHSYLEGGKRIDFTVGKVSATEMDLLGRAWVGADATKLYEKELTFYISKDRRTQYRPAVFKGKEGSVRANLEKRFDPEGPWISNAHFDVE